jgi:Amiloride-sensitive sodium channel
MIFEYKFIFTKKFLLRVSDDFNYKDRVDWKSPNELTDPLPWNISHTQNALQLNFYDDWGFDDTNQFQPLRDYRLIVHNNDEFSSYSGYHFFHMNDHKLQVQIVPEMTLLDDDVKAMSLTRRNCYLPHERKLKYFKVYTKKNCEQECLSAMMADDCGCVPFDVISKFQIWHSFDLIYDQCF